LSLGLISILLHTLIAGCCDQCDNLLEKETDEMSDKKTIEYDYQSSISYLGIIMTVCCLMGGFAFTGIIAFLTAGDPSTLLSQIILFSLFMGMNLLVGAVFNLMNIGILVSMQSKKPIIPIGYPTELSRITAFMTVGNWAITFSVPLMFLSKNLVMLFVLSTMIAVSFFIWGYLRNFKPILEEARRKRNLQSASQHN
jgi:hypothetical protein